MEPHLRNDLSKTFCLRKSEVSVEKNFSLQCK